MRLKEPVECLSSKRGSGNMSCESVRAPPRSIRLGHLRQKPLAALAPHMRAFSLLSLSLRMCQSEGGDSGTAGQQAIEVA